MDSILIVLKPLLLTIIIEIIMAYFLNIKTRKDLFNIVLINVITNSLLTLFINCYIYLISLDSILIYIIIPILELLIIYVEYKLFKKYIDGDRNYLLISFILNIGSFLGGILWQSLF